MKRIWTAIWGAGLFLIAASAFAQGPGGVAQPRTLWDQLLSTVVFSLVGIALAIIGFKLFDLTIKFDVEREICEKNNIAAGILGGAMVLGICLIVGLVVLS